MIRGPPGSTLTDTLFPYTTLFRAPAGAISESGGPDSGVPVLYVVDGDLLFGMAAEIARAVSSVAAFPAHYVVGIGYDADYADFLKLRTADLTPPIGAAALEGLGGLAAAIGGAESGGADAFLASLTGALGAEIAARYPKAAAGPQI